MSRSLFSRSHAEDIESLFWAHVHWLWSYAMCLPEQWRARARCTQTTMRQSFGNRPYSICSEGKPAFSKTSFDPMRRLHRIPPDVCRPFHSKTFQMKASATEWSDNDLFYNLSAFLPHLRTMMVSNRRAQQVFHLAAVLIERVMRLRLLWRVLCALASVSSCYFWNCTPSSPRRRLYANSQRLPNSLHSFFSSSFFCLFPPLWLLVTELIVH